MHWIFVSYSSEKGWAGFVTFFLTYFCIVIYGASGFDCIFQLMIASFMIFSSYFDLFIDNFADLLQMACGQQQSFLPDGSYQKLVLIAWKR